MVKLLYETFQCSVLVDAEKTEWFMVTTGVKQGCTMSGFLFLLVIEFIMKKTTEGQPGIPDKLIMMVKLLYETFQCSVLVDGEKTEWFLVTTGVKQGCTMSGFLFLSVIEFIMKKDNRRSTNRYYM